MSARIEILPSGHEFISEGHSSILEAGLRSGLRLGYGCSNGNCGQCLAKVISGDVEKTRHHDYRISEAQKVNGHVLMCCNTAVTDLILEAPEASNASEIPQQQITTKVKSIKLVNDDVALVHLKTPRTNRLRFLAGQHVWLGGAGVPSATHSIGSCPCDDRNLHFQIPIGAGNEFSDYVFNELKNGEPLEINGPAGDFILDEDSPRPLVFIAWRTGFSPIRSLIEHAMSLELADTIHLVWVAKNKEDRYLDNLCRSWADALDNFSYVPIDADVMGDAAFLSQKIIEQLDIRPESLADHDFYIAGSKPLLDSCKTALINKGVLSVQLRLDAVLHS